MEIITPNDVNVIRESNEITLNEFNNVSRHINNGMVIGFNNHIKENCVLGTLYGKFSTTFKYESELSEEDVYKVLRNPINIELLQNYISDIMRFSGWSIHFDDIGDTLEYTSGYMRISFLYSPLKETRLEKIIKYIKKLYHGINNPFKATQKK